ncbi:MAG: double zinc ribbon domain-containing protein [Acidimicrobiia bacterium]
MSASEPPGYDSPGGRGGGMPCAACGEDNPASARFCGGCGTALATTLPCPRCGAANPATVGAS